MHFYCLLPILCSIYPHPIPCINHQFQSTPPLILLEQGTQESHHAEAQAENTFENRLLSSHPSIMGTQPRTGIRCSGIMKANPPCLLKERTVAAASLRPSASFSPVQSSSSWIRRCRSRQGCWHRGWCCRSRPSCRSWLRWECLPC